MRLLLLLLLLASPALARGPCGGEEFPVTLRGGAPVVQLRALGAEGDFLVDYGATESSLARSVAGRQGAVNIDDFGLTGFPQARMLVFDYSGQRGIVGTNHLSFLTAVLDSEMLTLSPARCSEDRLRQAGFVPVSQAGFFSQDRRRLGGRVNVPVLWLEIGSVRFWAQVDTGYEDSLYRHSVDVNASLFNALRDAGVRLEPAGGVTVGTCDGSENREVWRTPVARLTDENGTLIRDLGPVHLIPKQCNSCGGIATLSEPAGQLGASFLATLGTIVFDPKGERLWLRPAQ